RRHRLQLPGAEPQAVEAFPRLGHDHFRRGTGGMTAPLFRTIADASPTSINRRLETLRRGAVVLRAAHRAVGEAGEDGARGRQGLAVDPGRRVPQPGARDRLGTLIVDPLDGDDDDAAWRLVVEDEALAKIR